MKHKIYILIMLLIALTLAACGSDASGSRDTVWDRVQSSRRIVIGTSADYPPFEYYDASYTITGFDAALARNLGEKLGLNVQLIDIPFEGLQVAMQTGQIDAAIAAISVTPERQAVMDFTNIYYAGQDAILARQGSNIPTIVAAAQLAPYRVAAQRGSIYATWLQKTLIDPGVMPQANLILYPKTDDAVRDLRENRNDLVVLDRLVADNFITKGGVVFAGQNLNTQLFAIALPKGASQLQAQLNRALALLSNDGTIARLTQTYLNTQSSVEIPVPLPTAIPVPPEPTPSACYDGMTFVQDVQVPDGAQIPAGQTFGKIWRTRNTGTCQWSTDYRLVFVQGNQMNGNFGIVTFNVNPGNIYDIGVNLQAPAAPGNYTGFWQMVNGSGVPFGQRLWVKITVPNTQPIPPSTGPVINYLNISSPSVRQGSLVIVNWSFSGQGIVSARLVRTNPDGSQTPLYSGADLPPDGQYEDLLYNLGAYNYTLNVSSEFGGTTSRTVVVDVLP